MMGADLYLAQTVQRTRSQYEDLDGLIDQMHELAHQDVARALKVGAQTLFSQVQAWATQRSIPPTLFDAVSQFRDLAQGETQAWLRAFLSEQVPTIERQAPSSPALALARHLSQLACGHTEEHLPLVIEQLQTSLQLHASPSTVQTARALLTPLAALVLHQDPTSALTQARETILQTIEEQQRQTQDLDTTLLAQARRVHRACNVPESETLVADLRQWLAFARQHAMDLAALAAAPDELLSTILARHEQEAATLSQQRETIMTVLRKLSTMDRHPRTALIWIEFTTALTARLTCAYDRELELIEQATDAAVLTQGDSRPWQEQQAERVVEALRPPLDVPTLSDVDAWSGDERPTMQAWRQMLQVAQQEAKRLQEAPPLPGDDRSQMETEPAFALAVQLRDLLHQEPTSRMCWLANELVAQLTQAGHTELLHRAEELRDLIHGDALRCLHTILACIQERVQIIAQQEQDVPSELLASIQTLQALLEGEVQAPLDRLMEQVHDTLTQHDITDPALLHALQQLPAVIEQGAGDALQEALHRVMQRLQILLSPPEASFRDPYHPAGLLLRLDLDWARDVLPQLDPASRQLSLDDVRRLIPLIEEAELQEVTEQEWQCLLRFHPVLGETLQTPEALMARLLQKKAELLQFLQRALAQGEPIYCDL